MLIETIQLKAKWTNGVIRGDVFEAQIKDSQPQLNHVPNAIIVDGGVVQVACDGIISNPSTVHDSD